MKCCCVTFLIALLLVIVLVCVALFVLTPDMLGIADQPIMGEQTLRDLGFENLTLFQVIQEVLAITTEPNDEDFITHTEDDLNEATTKLNLPTKSDGSVDYSNVLENGNLNNSSTSKRLTAKETAAVLDGLIKYSIAESSSGSSDSNEMAMLGNSITLADVAVGKNADGDKTIKITIGIKLREIIEASGGEGDVPPELMDMIHEGNTFITQEFAIDDSTDEIKLIENQEFAPLLINGKESSVIMALISGAGGSSSSGSEMTDSEMNAIQAELGTGIINMLNLLGTEELEYDSASAGFFHFAPAA